MTLAERADRMEGTEAVGDDGYRRIRSDVVFGRLRPGHKLKLETLKETYGVSVSTPARDPEPPDRRWLS